MNQRERYRRQAFDQCEHAEQRLVRQMVGQVDRRIGPPPAQLVHVAEADADDAVDERLELAAGAREH
jgi:hypothetical protein